MRVSSTVIVLGLSLYQAFADPVDLSPSAAPINAPNLRGSAPVQEVVIEESAKDPWSPVPLPVGGSPSASGLPWNLIQPWISGSGNNFNTGGQRFPPSSFPGQQQPGGWQSGGRPNGDYYDRGRRGGSSTGPCIHAFSPSDCYAVPTGECFWDNSEANGGRCESRYNEGRCGRFRNSGECFATRGCFWDVSEANGGRCEDRN